MIKINLLPKKEVKKKAALAEQGVIAIISIVVVIVVLVFLKVSVKGKIAEHDRQIVSIKNELEKLKKNEAEIEELKASEQILQQKVDVIKQLEGRKIGPVRMLDEIATKIPGKMWLTDLKSQGALLAFDGVAIDNETIAQFMTNLENSDQFDSVELKIAQETKVQDLMLKKFSLTAMIKGMKELEAAKATAEAGAKGKAKGKAKEKRIKR